MTCYDIENSPYVEELQCALEDTLFCIDEIFEHCDESVDGERAVITTICKAVDKYIDTTNEKISKLKNLCDFISQFKSLPPELTSEPNRKVRDDINDLINETITIDDIPLLEREHEITTKQIQAVLDILKTKYGISLSMDGKEESEILNLKLESDLDITPMDVKLFIPSMFLNHINSTHQYHPNASSAGVLFQEDFMTIESIANNPKSRLKQLVELYALIDNRRKPHVLLNEIKDKVNKSENTESSNTHKED